MATNEKYGRGENLSAPVPAGTLSGAPVRVGAYATGKNGVTQTKEGEGGNAAGYATVRFVGAHDLTVTTTTTMAAWDPVYITSGNILTPTATSNQLYGHILTAKGTAAGVFPVLIAN